MNHVYLKIDCEESIARELGEHFSFYAPGYKYTPQFKRKVWDGKIRLFHRGNHTIYCGLLDRVKDFAIENQYGYKVEPFLPKVVLSLKDVFEWVTKYCPEGFEVRYYQVEALHHCLKNMRALVLSPTASGKSKIIHDICAYLPPKHLVVVPNVGLVHQMADDFESYGFRHKRSIQKIYSGQSHEVTGDIVITTWQSIYTHGEIWFEDFLTITVDECHHAKAKCLTELMIKTVNIPFKFGFTGTLDGLPTSQLVLEGLFGPVYVAAKSKQLIEAGYNSVLNIKAVILQHPEKHCKALYKTKYREELDWLVSNGRRNRFITDLALSLKGNTLVLYRYVEKHGIPLHQMIEGSIDDGRNVYLVHGLIAAEERDKVREIVNREINSITVASTGCFSEGTNIPNLNNIIFASPSKSRILVMQAIGRVLRKTDVKTHCTVYDIGDDLTYKRKKNYTMKHMVQRLEYYMSEQYPYEVFKEEL